MPVQNLTNPDLAKRALLVMYAFDMCHADQAPTSNVVDPRIAVDGWNVVAILSASDLISKSMPNAGLRDNQVMATDANDVRRYGYVAQRNDDPGQFVVVIRGTDGAEEWADNFNFVTRPGSNMAGRVESGFFDIFSTMTCRPIGSNTYLPAETGIASIVTPAGTVQVVGHSLGSALATYLTYRLVTVGNLPSANVSGLYFASPKPGDHDFADGFQRTVADYLVINNAHDVVPDVPPFDLFHLDCYRALPVVRIIEADGVDTKLADDVTSQHHLICYCAILDPGVYLAAIHSPYLTADDKSCKESVLIP